MIEVIDRLLEEHRNIARLLDALDHQIEVFAGASRPDYDVISGIADYFLDYPDRCHHPKENAIFRVLDARHPEPLAELGDLLREHRTLHEQAVRFRNVIDALLNDSDISRSVIVGAATGFIDSERRHMRLEEEMFFPLAEATLGPGDWAIVEREIEDGRDPLFGDADEGRFATLRERLLTWEREFRIA